MLDTLHPETKAAELLGVSTRTLQRWRREGKQPAFVKINGVVRYRESVLVALLDSAARQSTTQAAA